MVDYIIGTLVLAIVVFSGYRYYKNRKTGGCSCGTADCSSKTKDPNNCCSNK